MFAHLKVDGLNIQRRQTKEQWRQWPWFQSMVPRSYAHSSENPAAAKELEHTTLASWPQRDLFSSVSSVAQLCPTLFNPMDCNTSGFPVHYQLLEFTQTQVHCVSDAIQQVKLTWGLYFGLIWFSSELFFFFQIDVYLTIFYESVILTSEGQNPTSKINCCNIIFHKSKKKKKPNTQRFRVSLSLFFLS